jgi:hypothetical protein
MSVEVGDKVIMIPLRGGGKVAVKSGSVEEGDKVVMIPIAGGSYAAVKLASPEVGDKVVLYPLRGGGFACLMSDATSVFSAPVVGWGSNIVRELDIPEGLAATQVAAGRYISMAIKPDGSVVTWGAVSPPPTGQKAVQIAAGFYHVAVIAPNGDVVAWDTDDYGQRHIIPSPVGLKAVQISCGQDHTIALKADGSVVGFGRNDFGQCDPPAGLIATQIEANMYNSYALRADGTLVRWGFGGTVDPVYEEPFVSYSAGWNCFMGLRSDGTVHASGAVGVSDVPVGLIATAISGGGNYALALRTDGSVAAWGVSTWGVLEVPVGLIATQVSAGYSHSLALGEAPEGQTYTISVSVRGAWDAANARPDGNYYYTIKWGSHTVLSDIAIPATPNGAASISVVGVCTDAPDTAEWSTSQWIQQRILGLVYDGNGFGTIGTSYGVWQISQITATRWWADFKSYTSSPDGLYDNPGLIIDIVPN